MTVMLARTSLPVHMSTSACSTCTCASVPVPDSYLASCPGGVLAWTSQPAHVHICLQCWRTTQHTPLLLSFLTVLRTHTPIPPIPVAFSAKTVIFKTVHLIYTVMYKMYAQIWRHFQERLFCFTVSGGNVCSLVMHSSFANPKKLIIYERAKKSMSEKLGRGKILAAKILRHWV